MTLFSWVCACLHFKGTTILWRVRNHYSSDRALHPRRPKTYNVQYRFRLLFCNMCPPPHSPVMLTGLLSLDPITSANCSSSAAGRLHSKTPSLEQCQWRWQIMYCTKSYSYLPSSCRIQTSPIIYLFLLVPCHIHLASLILLPCCTLHGRFCIVLRKFPFYLLDAPEKIHHQSTCKNHKIKTPVIHASKYVSLFIT
jgi:hypothetical protein